MAAPITVQQYVEPVFVIDYKVVDSIEKANVIPRWYVI